MFFEMSSSTSSYTKGIWILKEEERKKIPQKLIEIYWMLKDFRLMILIVGNM